MCFITLVFSTLEIKVFENDNTNGMEHSKIGDCGSNLDRKFVIQPAGIKPQCMCAGITIFSLPTLNSVQYMIQMVFITRKVDKLSLKDSSISSHDTAHSIGVDSKVHGTDALILYRRTRKRLLLLKCEAQVPTVIPSFEYRSTCLNMRPVPFKITEVRLS